jgi:leucyl aminopeptidase
VYSSVAAGSSRSATHVVAVFSDPAGLPRGLDLPDADKTALKDALDTPGFKADNGETVAAGKSHLILGLGKRDALDASSLRTAAAKLLKACSRRGDTAIRLHVGGIPAKTMDPASAGRAIGEAMGLARFEVNFFDGTATKREKASGKLTVVADDADLKVGLGEGLAIAEAVNEARRLAATPPNICNPPWFAAEAKKLARKAGLSASVISYAKAQELGLNGIVNVGRGSDAKPNMVILEHKPKKARRGVRLCLVGKTMTYDSGGYSLKIQGSMKGMKYDGCGGYAVMGAMLAIAALDLPVHVVALMPCAENMINGDAYRPDDIIEMYNGVSVEVTNTDAEGRMILADGLAYGCEKYEPTAIVDIATLTGGVVVALGDTYAGMWSTDEDLAAHVSAAAGDTDEPVWRMPLHEKYRDLMRAKHADIWNSAPSRNAHPIQGAAFLSYFVPKDVPWCHLDIAGMAESDGDAMHVPGPSGFGVRLLTELAARYARS